MPQDEPPESPTVVITQKMTAGKLALASRPPISTILSQNGIEVPQHDASVRKKKKRSLISGDAPDAVKKKKTPKKSTASPEQDTPLNARKARAATAPSGDDTAAKKLSAKNKPSESGADATPASDSVAPTSDLASLRSRRKERKQSNNTNNSKKKKKKAQGKAVTDEAAVSTSTEDARVVYIGHIPHGFYEREMRSYFAQFGIVSRLRLSRSRRTGASRGFAFVEFDEAETAASAADAMDGYMMHGRRLRAALVPPARLHASTFRGANRKFSEIDWAKKARQEVVKRSKNPLAVSNRDRAVRKRLAKRTLELQSLGIDYQMPTVA